MMGKCKCFCHWAMNLLGMLGMASAVLFIWTDLANMPILGKVALDYFMWAVVLLLLAKSNRMMCKCCNHGGCVCGAGDSSGAKTCSHQMGCKCGDCDRCR